MFRGRKNMYFCSQRRGCMCSRAWQIENVASYLFTCSRFPAQDSNWQPSLNLFLSITDKRLLKSSYLCLAEPNPSRPQNKSCWSGDRSISTCHCLSFHLSVVIFTLVCLYYVFLFLPPPLSEIEENYNDTQLTPIPSPPLYFSLRLTYLYAHFSLPYTLPSLFLSLFFHAGWFRVAGPSWSHSSAPGCHAGPPGLCQGPAAARSWR